MKFFLFATVLLVASFSAAVKITFKTVRDFLEQLQLPCCTPIIYQAKDTWLVNGRTFQVSLVGADYIATEVVEPETSSSLHQPVLHNES